MIEFNDHFLFRSNPFQIPIPKVGHGDKEARKKIFKYEYENLGQNMSKIFRETSFPPYLHPNCH